MCVFSSLKILNFEQMSFLLEILNLLLLLKNFSVVSGRQEFSRLRVNSFLKLINHFNFASSFRGGDPF